MGFLHQKKDATTSGNIQDETTPKASAGPREQTFQEGEQELAPTSSRFSGIGAFKRVMAGQMTMRRGHGDSTAVTALQNSLNAQRHTVGEVDGKWGGKTDAGLKSFQRAVGLSADAIIGKNTMAKLDATDTGQIVAPPPASHEKAGGAKLKPAPGGGGTTKGEPTPDTDKLAKAPTPPKAGEGGDTPVSVPPSTTGGIDVGKVHAITQQLANPSLPAAKVNGLLNELAQLAGIPGVALPPGGNVPQGQAGPDFARPYVAGLRQLLTQLGAQFPADFPVPTTIDEAHGRLAVLEKARVSGKTHAHDGMRGQLALATKIVGMIEIAHGYAEARLDPSVAPEAAAAGLAAASVAMSYVGAVHAAKRDSDGNRIGWQTLLEIFQTGAVPIFSSASAAKKIKRYPTSVAGKIPSWCGIFANFAYIKAGVGSTQWSVGGAKNAFRDKGQLIASQSAKPKIGDVGAGGGGDLNHHAVVVRVSGNSVTTVDGNSGAGGGGGQICMVTRDKGFFASYYVQPAKGAQP